MLEIIFIVFAFVTTAAFVLFLFSVLGKPPGEEVRQRMEQYLVETEMAAQQYQDPDEDGFADSEEDPKGVDDDDWVTETRGGSGGVKKVLANVGSIITPKGMAIRISAQLAKADILLKANEFVAIQFLAVMLSLSFGMILLKSVAFGLVFAVFGYMLPLIWVNFMKAKRV